MADVRDAVAASPTVVLCLSDYQIGTDMLARATDVLDGRVIVQLTAGTSEEAETMRTWCAEQGAAFLAGMVMVYPPAIGTPECRIVYAGDQRTFDEAAPLLGAFGGKQRHVGPDVRAVGAIAMSALEFYYLGVFGFVHAATLASREGVPAAVLLDEVIAMQRVIAEGMGDAARELDTGEAHEAKASIALGVTNVGRIAHNCLDLGVDPALPSAVLAALQRAEAAGLGDRAMAAVRQVLAGQEP